MSTTARATTPAAAATAATMLDVVARERTMDHSGYCSGDECRPDAKLVVHRVPLPDGLELALGQMVGPDALATVHVPAPAFDGGESGYCDTTGSPWPDVDDHHDYASELVCGMGV